MTRVEARLDRPDMRMPHGLMQVTATRAGRLLGCTAERPGLIEELTTGSYARS